MQCPVDKSKEKPEGEGMWKEREEMERRNWKKITKGGGRGKGRGRKEERSKSLNYYDIQYIQW